MESGWLDFATEIKDAGGLTAIAKTTYARNEWYVLKHSGNIYPQGTSHADITAWQDAFIKEEFALDLKEEEKAAKANQVGGVVKDAGDFSDNSDWWSHPDEKTMFDDDTSTAEETRKQLYAMYSPADKELALSVQNKLKSILSDPTKAEQVDKTDEIMKKRLEALSKINDVFMKGSSKEVAEMRVRLHSGEFSQQTAEQALEENSGDKKDTPVKKDTIQPNHQSNPSTPSKTDKKDDNKNGLEEIARKLLK